MVDEGLHGAQVMALLSVQRGRRYWPKEYTEPCIMEISVALMTRAVMMLLVQCHYLGYDHLPGRPLQRTKFPHSR